MCKNTTSEGIMYKLRQSAGRIQCCMYVECDSGLLIILVDDDLKKHNSLNYKMVMLLLSHFSRVQLCATP